jgi:AbiV family abortive infection protein
MQACIDHASDLITSAKLVQSSGKPHIAYHLAALALEEAGRRELIVLDTVASATTTVPPAWPAKHRLDHVQKMFWAFFGAMFRTETITKEAFEEIRVLAKHIHARRISGLYVDTTDGLTVPSETITAAESENLIQLVEARIGIASTEEHRTEASQEDIDIQTWFLSASSDVEKQKLIFSGGSMNKLVEVGVRAWILWLKGEFDMTDAWAREILKKEMEKSPGGGTGSNEKPKWRMRFRLVSGSHSIRPKALKSWNDGAASIRLVPAQKKNELIVELLFDDSVHISQLWNVGWITARRFVAALNLATRGFWWWHLPRQIDRYYDRIVDDQSGLEVKAVPAKILKINWGDRLVLDESALRQTMIEMIAATRLFGTPTWAAVEYYLGGLTFLSLNEIHWPSEMQAYGNFHTCLKVAMREYDGWDGSGPFDQAFTRLLERLAPTMPLEQRDRYATIARSYEANAPEAVAVSLEEVSLVKVLCDVYFAGSIAPAVLKDMDVRAEDQG